MKKSKVFLSVNAAVAGLALLSALLLLPCRFLPERRLIKEFSIVHLSRVRR